jgi:hypothetical protein
MSKIFNYIFHSFTNSPEGFSARKLAAFTAVITAVTVTFYFGADGYVTELVLIWLAFGLLCLGIITIQQIIDFKNGKTTVNETKKEEA